MTQRLRESIEELARADRRWPADAYVLVFEGLEVALGRLASRRHVSPQELVEGIRAAALEQFGLLAPEVLEAWNVHSGADFGDMVFNLVERGLLVASENDTRTEFARTPPLFTKLSEEFETELSRRPPRLVALDG